jgi:hypothetical protein
LKIKLPESYAGGSVTTGRLSHAGQAKGDDHDEKRYPRPPSLGFGVRPTTPHPVKTIMSKPPKYASDGARWEDFVQKIYITGSRDRRFGQTNCRQRRMETPFQGDQGPEWAVAPYVEGWMNGRGGGASGWVCEVSACLKIQFVPHIEQNALIRRTPTRESTMVIHCRAPSNTLYCGHSMPHFVGLLRTHYTVDTAYLTL